MRQMFAGDQNRRKMAVNTREINPPAISVSGNEDECAKKYWAIANDPPATAIAGRTSNVCFQPHMHLTSQNGMTKERRGN